MSCESVMKNLNPPSGALSLCQHWQTGSPLRLSGVFFMEKPTLIKDLGMRFANPASKSKRRYGLFLCHYCGKEFETCVWNVKYNDTQSCGCSKGSIISEKKYKHRSSRTKLYCSYIDLISRCFNPKDESYKSYGGRGITVCDEWKNSFLKFKEWAENNGAAKDLYINRINNDGNYEPSNCDFVDYFTNNQNTRLINSKNTSGFRGVSYNAHAKKWQSVIHANKVKYYLGIFNTAIQAAIVYNNWVIEHKTFHPLNIIPPQ